MGLFATFNNAVTGKLWKGVKVRQGNGDKKVETVNLEYLTKRRIGMKVASLYLWKGNENRNIGT